MTYGSDGALGLVIYVPGEAHRTRTPVFSSTRS